MELEEFVEVFISAIMLSVFGVIAVFIISPDIGEFLIEKLPDILNFAVQIFIGVFLGFLVHQVLDSI